MKIAILAASLVLCAAPAFAQTAPPALDAHKLELAHELIDAVHLDKVMEATSASVQKSMVTSMMAQAPKQDQAKASAMIEASQEELHTLTPRLVSYMTEVYARELTEKELTDSLAFYRSQSGQSILAKTPALMQEITPFMQQEMPKVVRGMFRRYCAKVTCTAKEQAQFAQVTDGMAPAKR